MSVLKGFIIFFFTHSLLYAGDFVVLVTVFKVMLGAIVFTIFIIIWRVIDILNTQRKRIKLSKKIQLFNTSDIGRNYIALGMVEWTANNQDAAVVKCLEQAQKMGASAIVNFQLATSTNVYTTTNIFNKNDKSVNSNVKYFYTGTAVKYK